MTRKEIITEGRKRYPKSKPMNYLDEGKVLGFVEGAMWMKGLKTAEELWISIKDKMPELEQLVIVWRVNETSEGLSICRYKTSRDNWKFKKEKVFSNVQSKYPFACKDVTHWMPFLKGPIYNK